MSVTPADIDPEIRHIACIGLMAAGKSVVGGLIADALGWPLVDVDREIEARTGRTVVELDEEGGEELYRPWERRVVLEALASEERSVLAAPGGIALDPDARKAIGGLTVVAVYLRADPDTLADRVAGDTDHKRPLVGDDPLAALRGMFRDRDAVYRALADVEVQVDDRSHEEVAALVLASLRGDVATGPRAAP
jgi:shikimate kinase